MKLRLIILTLALLASPLIANADPVITVSPTIAPNIFGSPSFPSWEQNAISALRAGVPAFGNPASPTYYYQTTTTTYGGIIVTDFPSWMGQTNPGAVFGAAFANELGNRALFSLHILGDQNNAFSISSDDLIVDLKEFGPRIAGTIRTAKTIDAGSVKYAIDVMLDAAVVDFK